MRVALDTNIVVSGLLWGGPPGELFDRVTDRTIEAVASAELIAELARILTRPKFAAKLAAKKRTCEAIVALYTQLTERVEPAILPRVPQLRDSNDRHVLACALAGNVDIIVSGDLDLLTLCTFENISILTPAECLKKIGG